MFAGVVSAREDVNHPARRRALASALLKRLRPLHQPDVTGEKVLDGAVVVQALNWNTPESKREQAPTVCPHTGNVLTSWLRLDNRDELARDLGLDSASANAMTDPEYVLAAYRRWGTDTARHLAGDFAIAVYEPGTRRLYLARDPIGIRPLFYARADDQVAFATTQACFAAVPGLDASPSRKWLTYYLAGLALTVPGLTAVNCANELPPGHQAIVHDGAVQVTRYHHFRDDPPWSTTPDPRYVDAYRQCLDRAVASRLRSAYPMGAENSGGLDSASILAVVRELIGPDAQVHTFGKPQFSADEERMLLAIERTSYTLHLFEHPSHQDNVRNGIEASLVLGHPPAFPNVYTWRGFLTEARRVGVRTIVSGHGGDEGVTNTGDLVARELANRREYGALYHLMYPSGFTGRAAAVTYPFRQRHRPDHHVPMRRAMLRDLEQRQISPEAIEAFGVRQHILEITRQAAPHEALNSYLLEARLGGPSLWGRAVETSLIAFPDKVEYRYPLLDVNLIQQYLSSPAIEKRGRGVTRALHRRAMGGALHEVIRTAPEKHSGALLPRDSRTEADLEIAGTLAEGILSGPSGVATTPSTASEGSGRRSIPSQLQILLGSAQSLGW